MKSIKDFLNKIICGDCLEVMKDIPDNSIDLTVTSPPYDNLRDYNGYTFDFKGIANELYRVTKDGGVVVWVVGDATIKGSETGTSFKQALYFKEIGFNLHDTMIYKKTGIPFPETNRYYPIFEYMFILSKGKPKSVNLICDRKNKRFNKKVSGKQRQKDGTMKEMSAIKNNTNRKIKEYGVRFNIWEIPNISENKEHPATFPNKLAEDHILTWSNENDIVLDPFCGSGTTCKMALKNNRKYIGIDISEEYCKISEARIKAYEEENKQEKLL
jgi:DNA modification methylase